MNSHTGKACGAREQQRNSSGAGARYDGGRRVGKCEGVSLFGDWLEPCQPEHLVGPHSLRAMMT